MSTAPPNTETHLIGRAVLMVGAGALLAMSPLVTLAAGPQPVDVTRDPLVVFAMVALLVGSVVVGLIFARPRAGLGPLPLTRHQAGARGEPTGAQRPTETWAPWPASQPTTPTQSSPWSAAAPRPAGTPQPGVPRSPWSTGESVRAPRWTSRGR